MADAAHVFDATAATFEAEVLQDGHVPGGGAIALLDAAGDDQRIRHS